tara:strand:- start:117 stop:728 length:612 start_codon:yes stop_codon:yes gene_type:complete
MNKFIVFEGIDGSGKTTQIKLLQEKFNTRNVEYNLFREPGGNLLSEKVRSILLDNEIEISNISETMLFLAARSQLIFEQIKPALYKGDFVICDRFTDSTFAYQGCGKKVDLDMIRILNDFAIDSVKPYLTILLDISYEKSLIRRGDKPDRMENNTKDFFNDVRLGYKQLADESPKKYLVIDATISVEEIHDLIWDRISKDFSL